MKSLIASMHGYYKYVTQRGSRLQKKRMREMTLVSPLCVIILTSLPNQLCAQGSYRNLGFELGTFNPIPGDIYNRVYAYPALAGWTASVGGAPLDAVLVNNRFIAASGVSVVGSSFAPVIQGSYMAALVGGVSLTNLNLPANVAISQSGIVPQDARSIRFLARFGGGGSFGVSLGGNNLTLLSAAGPDNFTTAYSADVSPYSGNILPLTFTVFAPDPETISGVLYLDAIEFSPTPVPEPSSWILMMVGAAFIYGFRRFQDVNSS